MVRESTLKKIEKLMPGRSARYILSVLYEDQGLTLAMIADGAGLSVSTVARTLREYGLEARVTAEGKTRSIIRKIEQTTGEPIKDVMQRLYIDERLGISSISARLGFSDTAIKTILFEEGFDLRDRSQASLNRYDRDGRKTSTTIMRKSC